MFLPESLLEGIQSFIMMPPMGIFDSVAGAVCMEAFFAEYVPVAAWIVSAVNFRGHAPNSKDS